MKILDFFKKQLFKKNYILIFTRVFLSTLVVFILNTASFSLANAELVQNLYKASILVANSSQDVREEATGKAMQQILVRASGKMQILSDPKTANYINKAVNYLTQFHYERTNSKIRLSNGEEVFAQNLFLTFSEPAIKNIIADLGYAIWDSNRPKTLFWILINDGTNSYLLNSSTNANLARNLTNSVWARGLPGYLPRLDYNDAQFINANKVWNLDLNSAIQASKNYKANAVVVARIYRQNQVWQSDWLINTANKNIQFSNTNADIVNLIRSSSYASVEKIAQEYAINMADNTGAKTQINIKITGVNNLSDYANLLQYLEKSPTVASLSLVKIDANKLELLLNLRVNREQFLSGMRLDKKLSPNSEGWFKWN